MGCLFCPPAGLAHHSQKPEQMCDLSLNGMSLGAFDEQFLKRRPGVFARNHRKEDAHEEFKRLLP
jgi:hypothetical protein